MGDDATSDPGQTVGVTSPPAGTVAAGPTYERLARARTKPQRRFDRGELIGRYVVLEKIGSGGMGVVYGAYDPDLDRRVALKLVHSRPSDEGASSEGRARLLREAQAMARLAHPNVITVHDVGTIDDQVFIAMEFIDGGTLKDWRKQGKRTRREILEVFIAAGRGLAAAHDGGLVHRDFKPENVLIGNDGRVCVLDFGIARHARPAATSYDISMTDGPVGPITAEDAPARSTSESDPELSIPPKAITSTGDTLADLSLSSPMTRTGALLGTPAYMAPEQHLGLTTDARTDQFSFCVALYEAVYGQRPFAGETQASLAYNVTQGEIQPAAKDSHVPGWLRKILVKGLARKPDDRHASMAALLSALGRDPSLRSRQWIGAAAVGVVLVGGVVGYQGVAGQAQTLCRGSADHLVDVWDDARKQTVRAAFVAIDKPFAEDAWRAVANRLDGYATTWVEMHTQACEATHIHGEQSSRLLDLRMACLQRPLDELAALAELLTTADAEMVARSVDAAHALAPIDACADTDALLARVPLPTDPSAKERVAQLGTRLSRARAAVKAGRLELAREHVTEIMAAVDELGYRPLEAEALIVASDLADAEGKFAQCEEQANAAVLAAEAAGDDLLVIEAWSQLAWAVGYRLARPADGRRAAAHAEAILERTGHGTRLEATLLGHLGDIEYVDGRYDESYAYHERSRALHERLLGTNHPATSESLSGIGNALGAAGKYAESLPYYQRALENEERTLGPSHPAVAHTLTNIGSTYDFLGDYAEAVRFHQRALKISEAALGTEHPDLGIFLNNLAAAQYAMDDLELARSHYQRAKKLWQQAYGADHPDVALTLDNLGLVAIEQERVSDALALFGEALAMRRRVQGDEHPDVAASLNNLGTALLELDRHGEAQRRHQQALEVYTKALGPDHVLVADTHAHLGEVDLERKRFKAALERYERALRLRQKAFDDDHPEVAGAWTGIGVSRVGLGDAEGAVEPLERALAALEPRKSTEPETLAEARFALAQAKGAVGDPSARHLAEQALSEYERAGSRFASDREEIERWLRRTR